MASAGLALGTGDLLGAPISVSQRKAAADKVKIAYVGIGNRGEQIIGDFARTGMVEVVALCDVDMGAPILKSDEHVSEGEAFPRFSSDV